MIKKILLVIAIFCMIFYSQNTFASEIPVTFPDTNLEAVIRSNIGKPAGIIYENDLEGIISLNGSLENIKNISGIEYCTNLTELNLANNQISDISSLAGLTNLTYLNPYNNLISDISSLAGLTNLTYLYLYKNQISDISSLAGLTNLTCLDIGKTQISDISSLAGLTNLTDLWMEYTQISDISSLAGLTNMIYLSLHNNQISDISSLPGLINLTDLDLSSNPLNCEAILKNIPVLLNRGVYVYWTNDGDNDRDDDGIPDSEEDLNQNGVVDSGETDPCIPNPEIISPPYITTLDGTTLMPLTSDLLFDSTHVDGKGISMAHRGIVLLNSGTTPVTINPGDISFLNKNNFSLLAILSNSKGFLDLSAPATLAPNGTEGWLITMAFDPVEIGMLTDTLILSSNSFGGSDIEIPLRGIGVARADLAVSIPGSEGNTRSVDFGAVPLNSGGTANRAIELSNSGTAPLLIGAEGIALSSGSAFTIFSISSSTSDEINLTGSSVPLAPNNSEVWTIVLQVDTANPGPINDTLHITTRTDGSYQQSALVTLKAQVQTAPDLIVTDSQGSADDHKILFDTVTADGSGEQLATATITLANAGEIPLSVPAGGISLPIVSSFEILEVSSNLRGPIDLYEANEIAGNNVENLQIAVAFDPAQAGPLSGSLIINSNDPNNDSVSVFLNGTGFDGPDIDIATTSHSLNIDFPAVLADGSGNAVAERNFLIRNAGTKPLTIAQNGIGIAGDSFFMIMYFPLFHQHKAG